ncbi:O-acetyl-ADP-ribose deacetylase [Auritidibacter sp. NML100628]|uniref:O-acetyl-ADP-ribose deacetylase n=1 Tax=Auritidibacter sp. NML100628 TaxID=2170742 RepID=UPI000D72682D|nr:O-acetyl-ADP-ribose deacetylase [Auritidibacter sp. NML100628]PXA78336.1 O-acetyl-ADP-ribose deacetylase [Auritidibacter sp. NML100628]
MLTPPSPSSPHGYPIEVITGDITILEVDAVVNAANSSLLGGGGVDGAIHRAGGPAILEACRALRSDKLPKGLPAGEAVATTAGHMPARWVIHTVGPVYSVKQDRTETLRSCYRKSLVLADELGATSVAFPAISAGVYGWPMDDATRIAARSCAETLDELAAREDGAPTVKQVVLVAYNDQAEAGFRAGVSSLA